MRFSYLNRIFAVSFYGFPFCRNTDEKPCMTRSVANLFGAQELISIIKFVFCKTKFTIATMRKLLFCCTTLLAALTCNAQTVDSSAGHEYVDLGLSVKWATCNIGASSPEEYGDYYAWGETETKDAYSWDTYKWCKAHAFTNTKYCIYMDYGEVDGKASLDPEDDVAHVKWGGNWRMPVDAEARELIDKCTWTRTKQGGVRGYKVTSKINGNSIFLPAAGARINGGRYFNGHYGSYWTATLKDENSNYALQMTLTPNDFHRNAMDRSEGSPVRPVYSEYYIWPEK